jgi:hypothetical protein
MTIYQIHAAGWNKSTSPFSDSHKKEKEENGSLASLFLQTLDFKGTIEDSAPRAIPDEQILTTFGLIREKGGFPDTQSAIIATAITLQKGGCNSSKNTQITTTFNGISIDSKTINGLIRTACRNSSPRSFARQIALEIFKISKNYKVPGNLKIKLEKNYPQEWNSIVDPDKDYWAADFQSSTPDCPDSIKFLIRKNYQEMFQGQTTTNTNRLQRQTKTK